MTNIPLYQGPRETHNVSRIPFYILHDWVRRNLLHHHDYAELLFVVGGEGAETINGQKHVMKRGTVSLLLPHHFHEISGDPVQKVCVYCCMFDLSLLLPSPMERALLEDL